MYHVTLNLKPTYPVHLQEDPTEVDCTEVTGTLYQNLFFDYENTRKSNRTRQSDISWHTAPLRGAPGVRIHHHTDESKVPTCYQYGYASVTSYQVLFLSINKFYLNIKNVT